MQGPLPTTEIVVQTAWITSGFGTLQKRWNAGFIRATIGNPLREVIPLRGGTPR